MENSEIVYFILSASVAVLAVICAYVAYKAMMRGLTYSATAATIWALVFIAIARVVHVAREFFELSKSYGEKPEMVEYVLYLIGYVVFVWLISKTEKIRPASASKS